ncbi:aldehyde dehydrogenase family protein [Variovorax sp. N23]|uniref:aldehyde dehydrogenase family protein n=1 Tax=Variovorax sp. N23 TaxID=2980555 RepID=UPI0021C71438|nr:aldehyde dehydrogenase family protein [Variovorax sp. N23]MCU4121857.1 aldehyde dehydrogenase family protein [Variovorax sp. N23]
MRHGEIQQNVRQYINGRWETSATTGVSVNPSDTREVVAEYARADRHQAELAVRAAADAFPHWARSTPQRRADVLDRIGSEILERRDVLGLLIAREQGKPLADAVAEAVQAGRSVKFLAGEALRQGAGDSGGTRAVMRAGLQVDVSHAPVGVVGVITPWSSPLAIPATQVAEALAAGNTVVFKPSERVPACGWALADVISRAGLPAGTFNLLMGSGRELGQALVDSPQVQALSFVGSAAKAERVRLAATARRARVRLDTGGLNTLVVLADADLAQAVDCAVQGAYGVNGHRGNASSRIVVEAPLHDAFVARLRERLATLTVGHALERDTALGPLPHAAELARHLERVQLAQGEGAERVWGGETLTRATPGHYLSPALFLARPAHRIAREPLFGPIACVLRAVDYEDALAIANDTPDTLSAALCTQSLRHALHFRRHAAAATTLLNLPTTAADDAIDRRAAPFFSTPRTGYLPA